MTNFMDHMSSLMTQLVDSQNRNLEERRENHSPIRRMWSLKGTLTRVDLEVIGGRGPPIISLWTLLSE